MVDLDDNTIVLTDPSSADYKMRPKRQEMFASLGIKVGFDNETDYQDPIRIQRMDDCALRGAINNTRRVQLNWWR